MRTPVVSVGDTFGRWTVVSAGKGACDRHGYPIKSWMVRCTCGKTGDVLQGHLRAGRSASCGCLRTEQLVERSITHGHTVGREQTRTYQIWTDIHSFCYIETKHGYKWHGAIGVKVCKKWHDFESFLRDMGECPADHRLHRRNLSGNFSKANCVWVDKTEPRARVKKLKFKGQALTITQWSAQLGLGRKAIDSRLWRGWSVKKALSTPLGGG